MGKRLFEYVDYEASPMPNDRVVVELDTKDLVRYRLRPVDQKPANPWIKDRLPTVEDCDIDGMVHVWKWGTLSALPYVDVPRGRYWRKIDATPPPADPEPTSAALTEHFFQHIEKHYPGSDFDRMIKEIRKKQESEGRDE